MDEAAGDEARRRIEQITADVEAGKIYEGKVVRLMDFGAFVAIMPGRDGMVHISQICEERVQSVSDKLAVGDVVKVRVMEIDKQGRIRLTMKGLLRPGSGEPMVISVARPLRVWFLEPATQGRWRRPGEVAERMKAKHWECSLGVTLTRVRIPLSPPDSDSLPFMPNRNPPKRGFFSCLCAAGSLRNAWRGWGHKGGRGRLEFPSSLTAPPSSPPPLPSLPPFPSSFLTPLAPLPRTTFARLSIVPLSL